MNGVTISNCLATSKTRKIQMLRYFPVVILFIKENMVRMVIEAQHKVAAKLMFRYDTVAA
jgi:hypothetical protein